MTDDELDEGRRQKPRQRGTARGANGEASGESRGGEPESANAECVYPRWNELMEEVVAHENIAQAMKRVRQNQGSPGIDGMTVDELPEHWRRNEGILREQLLSGTYASKPVRRVTIPKSDGGERELGIPTVTDRLVQQAISQVLGPRYDASFSPHSHGFRPGRSAHDASTLARNDPGLLARNDPGGDRGSAVGRDRRWSGSLCERSDRARSVDVGFCPTPE